MLDMDEHWELWDPPADVFDRAKMPGLPRHGIGRGFKVSKEQIVALLTALRMFAARGIRWRRRSGAQRLQRIAQSLDGCAASSRLDRVDGESLPLLDISVDESALGRTAVEVCRRLRAGSPPCFLGHGELYEGRLIVNPLHLDDATTSELARRLREELTKS